MQELAQERCSKASAERLQPTARPPAAAWPDEARLERAAQADPIRADERWVVEVGQTLARRQPQELGQSGAARLLHPPGGRSLGLLRCLQARLDRGRLGPSGQACHALSALQPARGRTGGLHGLGPEAGEVLDDASRLGKAVALGQAVLGRGEILADEAQPALLQELVGALIQAELLQSGQGDILGKGLQSLRIDRTLDLVLDRKARRREGAGEIEQDGSVGERTGSLVSTTRRANSTPRRA